MKKIITIILIACLAISAAALVGCTEKNEGARESGGVVNVYNWGEYISDGEDNTLDVIKEFEEKYNIKVNYVTFESNEQMYDRLTRGGEGEYDVIFPSDYMAERLLEEGRLELLNFTNIPNIYQIDERYTSEAFGFRQNKATDSNLSSMQTCTVPYMWGTVGIIYNTTMMDQAPTGWDAFFDPVNKDDALMFINERDSFMIAQKYLGIDLNTEDEAELNRAADALKKQKEDGIVHAYIQDEMFEMMASGEAALCSAYLGDIYTMIDDNPDLAYVFPKEGTNVFVDVMAIPKGAKNKENAEKFINFMCEKEIALANIEYTNYSTPHKGVFEELDDEVKNDEFAYPTAEFIKENCVIYKNLSAKANKLLADLWIDIKS
jgi:Spermidine/putrescine-binding periplasmic protein